MSSDISAFHSRDSSPILFFTCIVISIIIIPIIITIININTVSWSSQETILDRKRR